LHLYTCTSIPICAFYALTDRQTKKKGGSRPYPPLAFFSLYVMHKKRFAVRKKNNSLSIDDVALLLIGSSSRGPVKFWPILGGLPGPTWWQGHSLLCVSFVCLFFFSSSWHRYKVGCCCCCCINTEPEGMWSNNNNNFQRC
jgi:hypothetical protein